MKPWKIAIILVVLIGFALALRPLIEKPPEVEAPEPISISQNPEPSATEKSASAPPIATQPAVAPAPEDPKVTEQINTLQAAESVDDQLIALIDLAEIPTEDPRVRQVMIERLSDPEPDVRMVAIEVIRTQRDDAYVEFLKAELPKLSDGDTREMVKELIEYLELPDSYLEALNNRQP